MKIRRGVPHYHVVITTEDKVNSTGAYEMKIEANIPNLLNIQQE